MLALRPSPSKKTTTCTPHLLPLRINHNGPINSTHRHWAPALDTKGTPHVHFRGRHLHGTTLPLPAAYTGLVLRATEEKLPHPRTTPQYTDREANAEPAEAEPAEDPDVHVLQEMGRFEELVVWGHGGQAGGGDEFVRGVGEWVGFAEGVHCDEEEEGEEEG